jgi:hypothetical protein
MRPPEKIMRTSAIGTPIWFDLQTALQGWTGQSEEVGEPPPWPAGKTRAPASYVLETVRRVLLEQDVDLPAAGSGGDAEAARRCLGRLADHLLESGKLRDLTGVASHEGRSAKGKTPPPVSTLEFSRTLVVYAAYAPPLLLWTRRPSLRWFRRDVTICLRRFSGMGHAEGSA